MGASPLPAPEPSCGTAGAAGWPATIAVGVRKLTGLEHKLLCESTKRIHDAALAAHEAQGGRKSDYHQTLVSDSVDVSDLFH